MAGETVFTAAVADIISTFGSIFPSQLSRPCPEQNIRTGQYI